MRRMAGVLTIVFCCALSSGLPAADDDTPKKKFDPAVAFKRGDADGDGKLSKDEFLKLMQLSPAMKDKPEAAAKLFELLDTDKDGFLSLDEFKKIADIQGAKKEEPKTPAVTEKAPTAEGVAFFEKKIRPVLIDKCFECHSAKAEKLRGNLYLDTRDGVRKGGTLGPAIVPGNLKESVLIDAINHKHDTLKMPKMKLPAEVIADFEAWVKMGAPDPRDGTTVRDWKTIDVEKGRQFWAFQSPKKVAAPVVKDTAWAKSDIDRFLLAALEAKTLKPVGDADKRTLLRRTSYDLLGLPPSPEEVEAFVNDNSPDAFEKVVDKLLASPQFGERWGRHWLDVVRFAESSGKTVNFSYPHAWRYRDYVIGAFNSDRAYDRFVKEQLAGDLLRTGTEKEKADAQVATGFLAIGPKDHNERSQLQFAMDIADEQIDVTSQAFLGVTVGCARCHDHKFDPIPQKDYYAMAGIFRSTDTLYGTFRVIQNNHPSTLIRLSAESEQTKFGDKLSNTRRESLEKQLADLKKERDELFKKGGMAGANQNQFIRIGIQTATITNQLEVHEADGTAKQYAMGARDRFNGSDSRVYTRGEIDKPGETAPRGFVQVLSTKPLSIKSGSGRLQLAEAIASRDNPLTARVMANRVWLHLFGHGLVATPDNFGAAGQKPSHPELLDYLAVTFMDDGWSVKKLIRRVVLSRAYQLDSRNDLKNHDIDPDNTLVWRMAKKRQDAEALRDGMLAVSGQIELTPPKGSPVSRGGGETFAGGFGMRPGGFGPPPQPPATRSVYLPVIRNSTPEALALFDFAESSMVIGERPTTTVPAQGLYLLNNPWVIRQSEASADKLLAKEMSDSDRLKDGYLRFFGRPPSERESKSALGFLERYEKSLPEARGATTKRRAAWSALCQAWFASAEFLYVN